MHAPQGSSVLKSALAGGLVSACDGVLVMLCMSRCVWEVALRMARTEEGGGRREGMAGRMHALQDASSFKDEASFLPTYFPPLFSPSPTTSFPPPPVPLQTRVQASSASLSEVIASVPAIGLAGLYRGAAPAIAGQFASHGLRTGAYEASRMLLTTVLPGLNEYQVW